MICRNSDELLSFIIGNSTEMEKRIKKKKKKGETETEPVKEQGKREENEGGECIGVENEDQVGHAIGYGDFTSNHQTNLRKLCQHHPNIRC